MQGFFSSIKKLSALPVVKKQKAYTCADCPLHYQSCAKNSVEVTGEGKKGILILTGTMNISRKSVARLESELHRINVDLYDDCYITSVIQSVNPKHKISTNTSKGMVEKEITDSALYLACCRHKVHSFIQEMKPTVILAMGDRAMVSLVKQRSDFRGKFPQIEGWIGRCIPDQYFGSWIVPLWPINRLTEYEDEPNGKVYTRHFRQAVKKIKFALEKGRPKVRDDSKFVEVILDPKQAIKRMDECVDFYKDPAHKNEVLSFDYETTGLKPFVKQQEIVCVSMCWRNDLSIAFMLDKYTWPHFNEILVDKKIKKTAHNIQFEELWTRVKSPFKQRVAGWKQDTMLDAHILDNRPGTSGLKYQTYVYFGVAGYDDETGSFLEAPYPNDVNHIRDLPAKTVLYYCALDSLYGRWLALEQDKEFDELAKINPEIRNARKLFRNGAIALVSMTETGFKVDYKVLKANRVALQKRIVELHDLIMEDENVQKWKRRMGAQFNLNSSDQLSDTLFKYMGIESDKKTKSGKYATDAKTLADLQVPFLEYNAEIKKLEKLIGTYFDGVEREAPDGYLHAFYPLTGPRTFRSSSNSPNIQNIPKRWPLAKKMIRSALFPPFNGCLFEADYNSLEVGVGADYHLDPNMLKYLQGHGDMHRDAALDAFMLNDHPELMTKVLRQGGKNGFVFPEFYGDFYGNCAITLWKDYVLKEKLSDGTPVKRWLANKGVRNFDQFKNHMKEVERILWHERFAAFHQWREDLFEEYCRTGQYWNKTGFPYLGIMNKKDCSNYAVQGSAFHVNLNSMYELDQEIVRNDYQSRMIAEIHDAIIGCIHPSELNEFIPLLQTVMVDRAKAKFPWTVAPLGVEIEVGAIGKPWTDLRLISERPFSCKCGANWGFASTIDNGKRIRWECPICEHLDFEECKE